MSMEPHLTPMPAPRPIGGSDATSADPPVPGGRPAGSGHGPERVGPYRVLKEIGRGGMGVVYLAVRDDLPQRYVAIKLIHRGMAVGQVLERFHRERAALAALNHPNIARLLDGGTSERGEPYFVMEYIEGRPIDEYCDSRRLTITERLKLFRSVCAAVQHAHQHLVIHRDIKPRNILVGADGQPHLLDFGIAKLLNPALGAARDAPTETGLRLMTPEYASPEQIRGDPVTTVSDVYSLGVVLFELLTGRRPYRLKTHVWKELERVICEEDPDRPSTAVTRVGQPTPSSAMHEALEPSPGKGAEKSGSHGAVEVLDAADESRTLERIGLARSERPFRLRRTLAGDLDNIVLKALRKEPQRRYASAEQLAEDIQRHLDGMPVLARPDTFTYRATKFIRRHRGGVLAAGIVLAALLAGTAAASWQARVAQEERDGAQAAAMRAEAARIETQRALELTEQERARQREIARQVWLEISPQFAEEGGSIAARRALVDLCTGVYESLAAEAPQDDRAFWREFATGRLRSGSLLRGVRGPSAEDRSRALAEYTAAAAQFARLATEDPTDIESGIGWIMADARRADLMQLGVGASEEARDVAAGAVIRARDLMKRGGTPEVVAAAATVLQTLGDIEFKLPPVSTAHDRARPAWDESAALRRRLVGDDPLALNPSLDQVRRLYAAALVRQAALARQTAPGETGLRRADDILVEGEKLLRPMFKRDPGQPRNRRALAQLLSARVDGLRRLEQLPEAQTAIEEAIQLTLPMLGDAEDFDARQNLVDQRTDLGLVLRDRGDLEGALEVLRQADTEASRLLERQPNDASQRQRAAAAAMALGEMALRQQRADVGREALGRAAELWRGLLASRPVLRPSLAKTLVLLGDCEAAAGDASAAAAAYAEAVPLLTAMLSDPAWSDEPEVQLLLKRARGE